MAVVTQIASGNAVGEAATVWDSGTVPAIGDEVVATANFDLTWDDDSNAMLSFDRIGSTGTLTVANGKTLNVDGVCYLDGPVVGPGTIAVSGNFGLATDAVLDDTINILLDGTGNVTDASGAGGGNYDVNTVAGTHTQTTDLYCHDFKLTQGIIVGTGYTVYLDGTFGPYTAGTATGLSITQSGTNDADWNTSTGKLVLYTAGTGATITLKGTAVITQALAGSGAIAPDASEYIYIHTPADNFWSYTGACSAPLKIYHGVSVSSGAAITLVNANVDVVSSGDTLTMDGNLNIGTGALTLRGATTGANSTLTMSGNGLTCASVLVGYTTANVGSGIINFGSGLHIITGNMGRGNDANTANAFALDTGNFLLGGILNGDNQGTNGITVTSDGANIVASGASAEIKEVTSDNVIHTWGVSVDDYCDQHVTRESSLGGPAVNVGCGLAIAA